MEDKLARALEKAYEAAARVLYPLMVSSGSTLSLLISVDYDEEGVARINIEVEASRRGIERFEELLGEAANAAARAFEEEMGIPARGGVRLVAPRSREASSGYSQERRSRRGGRRSGPSGLSGPIRS